MSRKWVTSALAVVLAAGCWWFLGCGNNSGCVSGSTGNTFGGLGGCVAGGSVNAQTSFDVVGDVGTPFVGMISDTKASYSISGTAPLEVILVNSHPPIKMSISKNTNDNSLLSLELVHGYNIIQFASTSAPLGTVFVQTGPLSVLGAPASPDVRFFVSAPAGQEFEGLIEDTETGFDINGTVPTLMLFEGPNGQVDGQFLQVTRIGPFVVDLIINGDVVATAEGSPEISIVEPPPD